MQNFFNVLSDFGGLTEIMVYSLGVFAVWFNKRFERSKFIRSIYYMKDKQSNSQKKKQNIDFTLGEKLMDLRMCLCLKFCAAPPSKQEKIYK